MQGKIIKGIAGFYYVHVEGQGTYECRAKGIFRKDGVKPLVGDDVLVDVLDDAQMTGNIREILPRRNALLRPAVANVDQALVIFAIVKPQPNFNLLDRFLIRMERQDLPTIICFNKQDIASAGEKEALRQVYETCGCRVLFFSALENEGVEEIRALLQGKTTTVAGPSGVGKSSLINRLSPQAGMETGTISRKIGRADIPRAIRRSSRWGRSPISWIRRASPHSASQRLRKKSWDSIILSSCSTNRIAVSADARI